MAEHPTLLYLIDAHSYIYRAYHAISHLSTSHGLPTNAIFGVTNMLLKVLREKRPEYLAMVFDARGPKFRHALLETYKANRPAMPDDLSIQIPYIKDIIRAENLPAFELEGYEADDLIATIVKRLASDEHRIVIASGDKDLLQLVSPYVTIWDPMKDRRIDLESLRKEYGLEPGQMADVFALAGDAIDNVPGVPGIGPKTALSLIQRYRSVENLFTSLESIDKSKLREKLTTYREQALLSKELVTLHVDVPLEIDLSMLRVGPPDPAALRELFAGLEFTKFLKELEPADAEGNADGQHPAANVLLVDTEDALAGMLSRLEGAKGFSLAVVGTSPDPMLADISGIALCIEPPEVFYVPLTDINFKSSAIEGLAAFLQDSKRVKAGYNLKYALILLQRNGIPVSGPYLDVMIAAYLLDPLGRSRKADSLKMLAEYYLGIHPGDLGGQAMSSACAAAGIIARLSSRLLPDLEERELYKLFCEVEMP
ncbi:MAG: 5'-3' exonuclease H3TH domain-containing protein, partial [Thermodesulfobacteriota bacterium]|nr:5'-3' exonuclease H3TH domain-containing protein [Thermodesulfobacteriota bacterium]